MCRDDSRQLERDYEGVHDEGQQDVTVWHCLCWNCEEEEVRLNSPLVLGHGIA